MTTKITLPELLRWRSAQARMHASSGPSAARLLEMVRPWWETYPERFRVLAQQLGALRMGYGHAMVDVGVVASLTPVVPALMIRGDEVGETCVRTLYFDVTDSLLRMRFELDSVPDGPYPTLEVTLVEERDLQPIFTVTARSSISDEFWLEAALPESVARDYERLKVTSRMPFRLLLRP